jgi:UDP-galactose transporter
MVTYQLKILTTALFSVLLLSKVLSKAQWGSLVMLFVGIAMIQLQKAPSETDNKHQNQVIGLVAVTISCLSSGFAGVYMEKKIKNTTAPVWLKNIQLSIFGSMTAVIGMLVTDAGNISEKGFFHGYSPLVVFVIFQQAVGGLIVALVVKYADNILKGFSTSLSIIISCFFSVYMFNFHISFEFVIGTVLVILAIYIYGKFQAPKPSIPTLPVTIKPSVPETSSEMQHSTS